MRPTALKYSYSRIMFLLAIMFVLSLLNGSYAAGHLNQFNRLSRLTATICEKNNLALPAPATIIDNTMNSISYAVYTDRVPSSIPKILPTRMFTSYYVPQLVSDLIKECPV